jgi:hypothetical protein
MRLRFVDYTLKLLRLSQVMRKWHDLLAALDGTQRERIARFAEQIAGTLGRAAEAFERIERDPGERQAKRVAVRELGRLSGYVENIVTALEGRVDGRRVRGIRRRLEGLAEEGLISGTVQRADAARIDRLLASEGYFRALADSLRT